MKNKKNIYILLALVLLIWGAIVYQFFSYINPKTTLVSSKDYSIKPITLGKKRTISIKINPRDPFSGKMVDDTEKKAAGTKSKIQKPREELIWPQLKYKGIVSDTKDKIKIYMLIINGKTNLMKKGETQQEILLKDGNRDEITLRYKGESKIVSIQ